MIFLTLLLLLFLSMMVKSTIETGAAAPEDFLDFVAADISDYDAGE